MNYINVKKVCTAAVILVATGTAWAAPVQVQGDYNNYPMISPENVSAAALTDPGVAESPAVVYAGNNAGPGGFSAFAAATGPIGFDDYTSIASGPIDVSEVRFTGGVTTAGGILFFEFYDAPGTTFLGAFGVALTSPGNFIYTITVASGTVLADSTGVVQVVADAATTGQWFLSDGLPLVGSENPAFGSGSGFGLRAMLQLSNFPTTGGPFCFGDGLVVPCPCNNTGGPGAGCANSASSGALLSASGAADTAGDTFVLSASGLPAGVTAVFFQGNNPQGGTGAGLAFGDGLRCAAQGIIRLETGTSNGTGDVSTTTSLSFAGGVLSGETRSYQCWFRDTAGPCGFGSNTTNGWLQSWL